VYVAAARHLLSDILDPGAPAGPSESAILCDPSAKPEQRRMESTDRGRAWGEFLCDPGQRTTADWRSSHALSWRARTWGSSPTNGGRTQRRGAFEERRHRRHRIGPDTSIAVVNAFAPEHLVVMTEDPWTLLGRIRHAGEILMGDYPIISLGNYAMGVNAILPTGGAARTRSCVSVQDFLKRSSVGFVTRTGFDKLRPVVSTLSRDEGFSAHHRAVEQWNAPANAGDPVD
jgi:histidinol dehydrogenase